MTEEDRFNQALRMAADVCRQQENVNRDTPGSNLYFRAIRECEEAILKITPPTDPYQQTRAEGFAEARKLAMEVCAPAGIEVWSKDELQVGQLIRDSIERLQPTLTPSQDTVTMTREELETFGLNIALESAKQTKKDSSVLVFEKYHAIVAQRMPKESE